VARWSAHVAVAVVMANNSLTVGTIDISKAFLQRWGTSLANHFYHTGNDYHSSREERISRSDPLKMQNIDECDSKDVECVRKVLPYA